METKTINPTRIEGLCSTCIHREHCIYYDPNNPIYQCEEFDAFVEPRKINKIAIVPSGKKTNDEFAGLCKNCANRDTCMFAKPQGGVWHCEEYR